LIGTDVLRSDSISKIPSNGVAGNKIEDLISPVADYTSKWIPERWRVTAALSNYKQLLFRRADN